jgi:hypothetical protein
VLCGSGDPYRNDLLDAEERAALNRELEASIAEADAGETIDWDDAITELRAQHNLSLRDPLAVDDTAVSACVAAPA